MGAAVRFRVRVAVGVGVGGTVRVRVRVGVWGRGRRGGGGRGRVRSGVGWWLVSRCVSRTASKSAEGVKPTDCKKSTRAVEFWICVSTWLG